MKSAYREHTPEKASHQDNLDTSAVYASIVEALSEDYFDLYYVDVETGDYIEYGSWTEAGKRSMERHGNDFFAVSYENAKDYIYEEDLERFRSALDKEKLLGEIRKHGAFIFHYRLLIDGAPTYVSMKATRIAEDERHVIIGVCNVDSQVKDRIAAERAKEERQSYLRLSALNGNLIVLYFIDSRTGEYDEFSSSREYEGLGIAKKGTDFFGSTYENSLTTVHPEDQELFHSQVTKENILAKIKQNGIFVLDYRLLSGGLPTYVRLKAAEVEEDGKSVLILGLFDEDAQIRQEREYQRSLSIAKAMAAVDSLTGVKNKHAYVEWEEKINAEINRGTQEPFAVVVCDINNLKAVNDLYGHKEGDSCIKKACATICGIFSHSPVFRIGGDEFVVLLSGEDYVARNELVEKLNVLPASGPQIGIGETVSAGMAEYDANQHASLLSVFEDADKAMYERKRFLKETVLPEEPVPDEEPAYEYIPVINSRKCILIADDIEENRELMGDLLGEDYDVLYASDGVETLEMLRSHSDDIDLVLLDLMMPNKNGREVIAEMQVDEDLMSIPVIILTVDQSAELDCLKSGVMDFVPKPYPDIEIVKARIARCIELSEDRELIRYTERDKLTGLLNKDFFYRYVRRLDHIYKDTVMDALVCDVDGFHTTNKKYGRQFGDHVLHCIGVLMKKLARETGGIACRQGGDIFLLYCPHQDDYGQLLTEFRDEAFAEKDMADRVNVRFGVFTDAQQEANIEDRFDRAKIAADRVKDHTQQACGFYDLS